MSAISHYKAELRFALILVALTALSIRVSRYVPDEYFDNAITPILMSASTAVALCCAWITSRLDEYPARPVPTAAHVCPGCTGVLLYVRLPFPCTGVHAAVAGYFLPGLRYRSGSIPPESGFQAGGPAERIAHEPHLSVAVYPRGIRLQFLSFCEPVPGRGSQTPDEREPQYENGRDLLLLRLFVALCL